MWAHIRQEKSDLGLHCLTKRLLKHINRRQKQATFVMIGAFRIKMQTTCSSSISEMIRNL